MAARSRSAAARPRRRRKAAARGGARATARARRLLSALWARLARLPLPGWLLVGLAVGALVNCAVQVARKPTELIAAARPPAPLLPAQTWARYGALCRENATSLVRAEVLAALVQVESSGDALARTPWRWRWSWNPFDLYAPASSAVGILQITDGTFDEARRFCIHDHAVARDGAWYDPGACWFNALYVRTSASDAIEMTAARMHVLVAELMRLAPRRPGGDDLTALAAVAHLCGRERARAFAVRGYRLAPGERCGDHDARGYVERVRALAAAFARLERDRS